MSVFHIRINTKRIAFLAFSKFSGFPEQIGSTFWSYSINSTLSLSQGVYSPGGHSRDGGFSRNIMGVLQAEDCFDLKKKKKSN